MSPRRDRTGELIDDDAVEVPAPREPCSCDAGWIDRDADHPQPCLRCRPHLRPDRLRRQVRPPEEP